jgi:hypothetical protein
MRHSTGKPTREESAWIVACKEGFCIACLTMKIYSTPCDYHHFKSGNVRRGHMYGIGLCGWHHRGLTERGWSHSAMRMKFGPSLIDGSRLFRDEYGTDDELLATAKELLGSS